MLPRVPTCAVRGPKRIDQHSGPRAGDANIRGIRAAHLDSLLIRLFVFTKIAQPQPLCPIPLVQVAQHALFQLRLSVIDRDRVVVAIQTVDK